MYLAYFAVGNSGLVCVMHWGGHLQSIGMPKRSFFNRERNTRTRKSPGTRTRYLHSPQCSAATEAGSCSTKFEIL